MTANQISYKVGTDTTTETKRHNLETERLQQQMNSLEESRLRFQDDWKRIDQSIQQEYNRAYLDYLDRGLSEKEAHDKATDSVAQQRADNDAYYQTLSAGINEQLANLTRARDIETQRHNKVLEQWESMSYSLKAKDLQYQQSATLLQNSVEQAKLAYNEYKTNLDAEIANSKLLMEAQIAKTQLELDKYKTDVQAEMQKQHEASSIGQTIISGILHFAGRR